MITLLPSRGERRDGAAHAAQHLFAEIAELHLGDAFVAERDRHHVQASCARRAGRRIQAAIATAECRRGTDPARCDATGPAAIAGA